MLTCTLSRDIVDVKQATGNVYSIFMGPLTEDNDKLGESDDLDDLGTQEV